MITKKLTQVIAYKYLPTQTHVPHLALVYGLYTKVYALPLWADLTFAFLALCFLAHAITKNALEVEVHPKDLA
jgi:hypothetical protein